MNDIMDEVMNLDIGLNEGTVSVPGGDSETPKAKPYDKQEVSVPGGDSETPHAKPHDAASVSIPASTNLTADQYNAALTALKKTFKEGYEVMEMLENANITHVSTEQRQQEYVESAVDQAILEAYEEGPIFEKVKRADKNEVKKIVKKIRPGVEKLLKRADLTYYKPNLLARTITGIVGSGGAVFAPNMVAAFQQIWSTRLWQVIGIVQTEDANIRSVISSVNEQFAEDLGDYKIIEYRAAMGTLDFIRQAFGWKNQQNAYFLLVDTNVDKELKSAMKSLKADAPAKDDKESDDDK